MHAHGGDEKVTRFSTWQRLQHAIIIVLFVVLLVTGMPQKWPYFDGHRWLIDQLGGIYAVRWAHRTAGLAFVLLLGVHLATAAFGLLTGRSRPDLLIAGKDFRDAVQQVRYALGLVTKPPRFGRFDYRQKFEYWGLFFGASIMAVSGLALYFPIPVSRMLPAELIPVAKVLHSNEAMLAFLIVLIWHMYSAHLKPESFPADTTIFTGKISKERLYREHPLEFEERFPGEGSPRVDRGVRTDD